MTRISEACDSLHFSDLKGFFSHSTKCFDNYLVDPVSIHTHQSTHQSTHQLLSSLVIKKDWDTFQ
ncbi:uncharacterized protein B0P05DRAFT_531073 [Gilbertella persicaria]|uniref:uncharacterized protein n=1 Tax=Gilbertella persicaria TaxID=101096 RepID=UPI002220FBC0|nr:uncharacterized protein B0P05DRAFT_531073 [Gilbertella persicaria]KAI8088005.1 hypothetical protein B0P05DRAFT_531073 [Gilbertella persicaria]